MKRLLSLMMVLLLVISMLPVQAFASELEEDGAQLTAETEETVSEETASEPVEPTEETAEEVTEETSEEATEETAEEVTEETSDEEATEETAEEATEERVCLDGCILETEEEHLENGGECLVWIPCATEGCEGAEGHEGECYGVALYADGCTLSVSGSSYYGRYVVINETLYYINSTGTVVNTDGTAATFEAGTYTVYYGIGGSGSGRGNESTFATGSVTVAEGASTATVTLRSTSVSNSSANVYRYATSLFYNTASFDHVDVRVAGSYVLKVGNQSYTATVSNPIVVVEVGGSVVASQDWTGDTSETYEWRQTGLSLSKASVITVRLTLDLTYTDSSGVTHVLEDVQIVYDSVNHAAKFIDAIAICDMVQGLDFRVDVEEIQKVIVYHNVSYEWKVYNTDGTYTTLPAGAPNPPATTGGHEAGSQYTYDTEYVTGTSFYDYDNGLLYTFHGWDTYSHSATYNPVPGEGYYALDDGDTNAANNATIEITADTYIYGYWTVSELEPSAAHISIEKIFYVDGVEMTPEEATDLWFRIDTGIDRDGDGETLIDVDYTMILAASGEYKIPVYQYDTPFSFTEYNADIPGYTRVTTVQVTGSYITGSSQSGDSVTVSMEPVYVGENVHLGTVTYINSYTKNQGAPVSVYPSMILVKSAADTGLAQEGVVFTLYADENCTEAVTTVTTGSGGLVKIDFAAIEGIAPGTYYLKETQPLDGYYADPYVYAITLAETGSVEELRNGEYVTVTTYGLTVAVPEGSTAVYDGSNRLHIFDAPVLGSLSINKETTGLDDADLGKLTAVVIVHGPITRDANGAITDIGDTWQLELNSANGWAAEIGELPLGEYLIHESFASVHGYNWTGVSYGDLTTTVYNGITSGVILVEDETPVTVTLTNSYEEWEAADFYIRKVNESGAALAGAVFTLSTDEAGTDVIATGTTGADGYAYFSGYSVPDGESSVTYYLRETKAPAGYYLSSQVYKVVIAAEVNADTGKTSYETEITLISGRNYGFNAETDLLTVVNYPVLGELTLTKTFKGGLIPDSMTGVSVRVDGPSGYTKLVELNSTNGWTVTLTELPLGTYTVTELDANVPGYTWEVIYSSTTVTLAEQNPGMTQSGTEISGSAAITNGYTRNEEIFEVPTSLTVKKVGENGEPLAGAVFTLVRMGDDGSVISTVSYTTGASGIAVFDLLSGSISNGAAVEGTYILTESKAPAGYTPSTSTWTVTIVEDDGEIRWTLNENKNVFEGYWEWIVGDMNLSSFANGVLTVRNVRNRGSLTVEKTVSDPMELYADASYTFTLDCSDDTFDTTFTLKAGESITVENIPWGTTYTLTEDTTGAAFTSTVNDGGNGTIWAEETVIEVTNTYAYTSHHQPLVLVKVDADTAEVIAGAGFTLYADAQLTTPVSEEVFSDENGLVQLNVEAAGIYYLAETTTPAGYHPSTRVYTVTAEEKAVVLNAGTDDAVTEIRMYIRIEGLTGTTENQIDYTYMIENTAIQAVEVSVEKIWDDGGYHARPESVEITLYRDGEAYETVTLSEENGWAYTWTGLTDEYTWTVDETAVPEGYTKTVANEGDSWTVTNTRTPNPVAITVTKAWELNGGIMPDSVTVTLYRNGDVYETVVLTEKTDWTHTWTGLDDTAVWSVDETEIPEGYTKTLAVNGYDFVITNSRDINPVEVSVEKIWYGANVTHPTSIQVTLYRDGEAYDTVTLSADNNWTYTWTDLTDEYTWTVDEPSVPSGYVKTVRQSGNHFIIVNTHEDNPKTGDAANLLGMGAMAAFGMGGFGICATALLTPKKKKEEEE